MVQQLRGISENINKPVEDDEFEAFGKSVGLLTVKVAFESSTSGSTPHPNLFNEHSSPTIDI